MTAYREHGSDQEKDPADSLEPQLAAAVVDVFVWARFRQASTPIGKVLGAFLLWVVLFGSKFLVLEAVALVFGERVSLGGFFSVTLLILVLLLSRAAVRRLLQRPHQRAQVQG